MPPLRIRKCASCKNKFKSSGWAFCPKCSSAKLHYRKKGKAVTEACRRLAQSIRRNRRTKQFETETITIKHLFSLWYYQKGRCAISGLELGFPGSGLMAASIDRKDNSRGYMLDNIQIVCKWANLGRGKHSIAEMQAAMAVLRDCLAPKQIERPTINDITIFMYGPSATNTWLVHYYTPGPSYGSVVILHAKDV